MFTLNEAYTALQNHKEFAIKKYNDGLVCLDYIVCFPGTFDTCEEEIRNWAYILWEKSPEKNEKEIWEQAEKDCHKFAWYRRNFRGVTFFEDSLVSLPLHKFYNLNQVEETQFDKLKNCKATIYEKSDGSMIHFFIHPKTGDLQAATCRGSETPQAQEAIRLAKSNKILTGLIEQSIMCGWTPIFEFVSPTNQIVVRYKQSNLVYLISRHRNTGEYHFDETFPNKAERYEFAFEKIYEHLDRQEFEGYVCHLDNGMIVKAKTPWYLERHRAVDAMMRPAYKLYQVVFDGVMDDLIAIAPDYMKSILTKIYTEAQSDLLAEKLKLEKLFEQLFDISIPLSVRKADKGMKKSFVEKVRKEELDNFSFMMTLYGGNDVTEGVQERLMEQYRIKYPNRICSDLEDDS